MGLSERLSLSLVLLRRSLVLDPDKALGWCEGYNGIDFGNLTPVLVVRRCFEVSL